MTYTTIEILVKYKSGLEIQQIRSIKHRCVSNHDKRKNMISNKLKKYQKTMQKFNNDILSIELIKQLNYTVDIELYSIE